MPLSLNERNPDLIARVDDAYERALAAKSDLATDVGGVALDALVESDVAVARAQGTFAGGELAIANHNARTSLESTLVNVEQVFAPLKLKPPTPDELRMGGVDFASLGRVYERMEKASLQPTWVLAPDNLRANNWEYIYRRLQDDPSINTNGLIQKNGLRISSVVQRNFEAISARPENVPSVANDGGYTHWTLRLIPSTPKPTEMGVSYADTRYPVKPTVAEYLTLQAVRLQAGEEPIDDGSWTNLQGTFMTEDIYRDNELTVTGTWGHGRVAINEYKVADTGGGAVGMRLPEWK
jgi:hypothetical protein